MRACCIDRHSSAIIVFIIIASCKMCSKIFTFHKFYLPGAERTALFFKRHNDFISYSNEVTTMMLLAVARIQIKWLRNLYGRIVDKTKKKRCDAEMRI